MEKKDLRYYIGDTKEIFLGYSEDKGIRLNAASGGCVSAILIDLLEKEKIDAALVSFSQIKAGQLIGKSILAKTKKEILSAQTSTYFFIPTIQLLQEVVNFKGKIAIVCLPCEVRVWRKLIKKRKELKEKIYLIIGLFCGHASQKKLIQKVLEKRGHSLKDIQRIIFRKGHWRGKMHFLLKNGKKDIFSFWQFSTYQNLFFYSERKCIACSDHTSELADISCGDVWDPAYKNKKHKYSLILVRTKKGEKILKEMLESKKITGKKGDEIDVWRSQKRSLIFHKRIKARAVLGKIFGYQIDYDRKKEKAGWNDYLAALMILSNLKISESRIGEKVLFLIPQKAWFLYLVLIKLLTSF